MASTIKVTNIDTPDGTGSITIDRPIVADISNVTGTLPAISGANLTALPAANLTGSVPSAALGNMQGKGADIASAGTMTIGTDGGYFDITGTTGITAMTVAAGRVFTLQFDGAVTLTHSSTLYLSGAANFTTEANDHLTFISVAANDVRQIGTGLKDGGSPVTASGTDYAVVRASRNMDAASGNQDITGMGFQPAACMVMVGADATHQAEASWGWTDFTANGVLYSVHNATADTFKFYYVPVAEMEDGSVTRQVASITALADGVRLAWVKGGTTDSFTMTTTVLGFK